MLRLLLVVPVCLAAVACGGSSPRVTGPYLPGVIATCLRDKGFHVSTSDSEVPLVISTAEFGGLRAWHTKAGNQLQIAFTAGGNSAKAELRAITRVAPPRLRRRIADVTRIQRNAVLLWTIAPSAEDQQTVFECLPA